MLRGKQEHMNTPSMRSMDYMFKCSTSLWRNGGVLLLILWPVLLLVVQFVC